MKNKSIDEIIDALDHTKKVNPSDDFIERVQSKALSFAELKAKYGKQALLLLIALVAAILVFNIILYKKAPTTNTEEVVESEYDMSPVKTYDYE